MGAFMSFDARDLNTIKLPAFELDCRDWLVATPDDGTVPDEIDGAPVVAVLSTVVIGESDFAPASAVLSVGLLDEPVDAVRLDEQSPVAELIDFGRRDGAARYVVPAPDSPLALLAELDGPETCPEELADRFRQLMTSFRWAS